MTRVPGNISVDYRTTGSPKEYQMTQAQFVIRQVKQPCLAFKILGTGRRCASQDMVREAFEFAFQHLKPSDAVIVGMYPRDFDQVRANAAYVRSIGGAQS